MTDINTGAPYPRLVPGSNGIGTFSIGISPIGIIPPFDLWKTVISQYANSPILMQLIENIDEYIDQTVNFQNLYDFIWNVDTAQGYGLDVWGRIVNVARTLTVPAGADFGFEGQSEAVGFNQAPFGGGQVTTGNYSLADSAYRTLIFAKALANITDGSTPAINQILLNLFPGRGNCYVTDQNPEGGPFFGFDESTNAVGFGQQPFAGTATTANMTIYYVFKFTLSPVELAIVQQSGVLPKSTGVAASVVQQPI